MFDFTLQVFPQGSLSGSVITTVWVGVMVVCMFNLRFGWVLSGLVIPGYLTPLFLSKPISAGVVCFEGVVTYILVWFFSEFLSKYGGWSNLFGRDRFFALLLTSVLVRLVFDTILLPVFGEYLISNFNIMLDYRNNLYSFGLIVVALIANQFWKPGLLRGIPPLVVSVTVTYVIIRYGLMVYTNFSLSNLTYMYEDLAVSMLASPKAYIILLTTSYVASRMNLFYGWEYNGILIPALLALQWYQPMKIAASFMEAFAILMVSALILRLPIFKSVAVEGARKILLFFNVSFFYKMGLGHLLYTLAPSVKVSDYFGFGYLLPSLLAIKMYDKDVSGTIVRASVQTSLVSIIIASFLGYGLTFIPNVASMVEQQVVAEVEAPRAEQKDLLSALKTDKVGFYKTLKEGTYKPPLIREIEVFTEALLELKDYVLNRNDEELQAAVTLLSGVGYRVEIFNDNFVYLSPVKTDNNWGVFVINLNPLNNLMIQVPATMEEWRTMESGAEIFRYLQAGTLAISGTSRKESRSVSADPLLNTSTFLMAFQGVFGESGVLQIRGYTISSLRKISGIRTDILNLAGDEPGNSLWVKDRLPANLNITSLKEFVGDMEVLWQTSPQTNALRNGMPGGFAELYLNRSQRRELFFKPYIAQQVIDMQEGEKSIVGYLQDWLLSDKLNLAKRGDNTYQSPKLDELLYFDIEILTPLLQLVRKGFNYGSWSEQDKDELGALAASARIIGYDLVHYQHEVTGADYIILVESENELKQKHWGTYVFRLGLSNDFMVQVPRPLYESNVYEYGLSLFERLDAQALLISGAHPNTNLDGSSDVLDFNNKQNLFSLVSQVVLREAGDAPFMAVQCRAFGFRPGLPQPEGDVLVSFKSGLGDIVQLDRLGGKLIQILENDGLLVDFVDGSVNTAGYEVGSLPQGQYLSQTKDKELALLWLSPLARASYKQQDENTAQQRQFAALGISSSEESLFLSIQSALQKGAAAPDESLLDLVLRYQQTRDVIVMAALAEQDDYRVQRLVDLDSKQGFLFITRRNGSFVLAANIYPRNEGTSIFVDPRKLSRFLVEDYIAEKVALLMVRGGSR